MKTVKTCFLISFLAAGMFLIVGGKSLAVEPPANSDKTKGLNVLIIGHSLLTSQPVIGTEPTLMPSKSTPKIFSIFQHHQNHKKNTYDNNNQTAGHPRRRRIGRVFQHNVPGG